MTSVLVVDLGGTKSRVGFFEIEGDRENCALQRVYRNKDFTGIAEIIDTFHQQNPRRARHLCIALAGVVKGDRAALTNLDWRLDKKSLQQRFAFEEVLFINDLTALAAAVPQLEDDEMVVLKKGEVEKEEAGAIIAPGTGLGQGFFF
ncbi:MAG TPA: glucokinase, partial [Desulfopila sp.]|nr:glucokinase [Desulfopila sp.]